MKKMYYFWMTATAISLVLFGCVSDPIRPVAEDWDVLDKKPQTSWFDSKKSPLVMSAEKEVIDESAIGKGLRFKSVLILQPVGKLETEMNRQAIERLSKELTQRGIKVFATAVPYGMEDDLEDILVKAQEMTAPFDAVFQLEDFAWSFKSVHPRLFVTEAPGAPFAEVTQEERRASTSPFEKEYSSPEVYMTGRFIMIKAEQQGNNTISMRLPLNHALPRRYEAQISFGKTEQKRDALFTKSESFPYYAKSGEYWINAKTRKDAEERIIAAVAEKLVKAISPEQPQSPPSVKLAKAEPSQPPPVMVEPKKSFLKMSADKEIIDESVVDADLKFTGVLILLPEGNRATEKYKQDVEAISREFKRQGIKVFTTAVPYGMADEIKDIIIKVQTTAVPFDVIYQMTSLVWETNSIAPRIFIAEKLGEPYREVTQAQRRESKSKIVQEFASPELCSEGRLIAVRTEQYQSGASYANNQQLASIKMRLPLNHVLPQDYEAQISFMPLGEGKYRPEMKEVSFPYWANGGEAWNNDKTKKDAEDKLNAAIVARLVKGNK